MEGTIDLKRKYIEVRETERTKTNIPTNIRNCLQVHKLTYFKQGNTETLEGNWLPAPNQEGGCGFGTTALTRRSLSNSYPEMFAGKMPSKNIQDKNSSENTTNLHTADIKSKLNAVKKSSVDKTTPAETAGQTANNNTATAETKITNKEITLTDTEPASPTKLDKRKSTVLKTIEVGNHSVKIDLYDNGEIDGDSVSIFYNGKMIIANRKLTARPISFILDMDEENAVNELAMYAENLGSIPPNTALMIVTDGPNRYEVRITSDLEKSGVIRFILKSNKQ